MSINIIVWDTDEIKTRLWQTMKSTAKITVLAELVGQVPISPNELNPTINAFVQVV